MNHNLSTTSTMAEVLATLPGAKRALFAKYHLGGCQSCAFGNEETLATLADRTGADVEEMLAHLLASDEFDSKVLVSPVDVSPEDWLFVDLRTREEHDAVKIEASEFFTQDLQQSLFAGNPARKILLYDHTGGNVLDQVAWFRGHGLHETYGLRGGIDAWSKEVDPSLPRYRLELE